MFAFEAIRRSLEQVDSARVLLRALGPDDTLADTLELAGDSHERSLRNQLMLAAVARDFSDWIASKTAIRAMKRTAGHNLFVTERCGEPVFALHGSSRFNAVGMGQIPGDGYDMNTTSDTAAEAAALAESFQTMWADAGGDRDIKPVLLEALCDIHVDKSPEQIYFRMLHAVFEDHLGELDEENIIKTGTGIKATAVWNKLYRFQRDGVLGVIDKIERYNGCILADSVGLGKTFEALAVIKYYELRNDRVLVLAPKKLRENWTLYTVNDTRNVLADDRFNFDLLNHTDLTREDGYSGEINLETVNWGNYDLVVIDESHNFRNNPPRKDGLTRYGRLMRDIIRAGVKTKVLMLSATRSTTA